MTTRPRAKPTYGRIENTSTTVPRIDSSEVAQALGADPSELTLEGLGGGPLSLYQVRQELFRRLQSTGGRPSLSGTSGRKKIPLNSGQWQELEEIASEVASASFTPSAGQIASVLLTLSLRSLRKDEGDKQRQAPASRTGD